MYIYIYYIACIVINTIFIIIASYSMDSMAIISKFNFALQYVNLEAKLCFKTKIQKLAIVFECIAMQINLRNLIEL